MGKNSAISWTHHTFNSWWGCQRVSEGCRNCYAADLAKRYGHPDLWTTDARRVMSEAHWRGPLKWARDAAAAGERHRVFCGSMMDWAEDHPLAARLRPRLWDLIRATPALDWLMLSKRADRIASCLPPDWGDGWPHVWLGTTVEHAVTAWRLLELLRVPARVRFVSYEPALGPLDAVELGGLDWLIYGGESGPKHRPDDDDWCRALIPRCRDLGIALWRKQGAGAYSGLHVELDGNTIHELPSRRWTPNQTAARAE